MTVVRGYKTELDLTDEQLAACMKHARAARFAYNWGLARSKEAYRTIGKRPTAPLLHKELNALKKTDYPWMDEVLKCAPQEALRDLERAYKDFLRRVELKKQGKWKGELGFPHPRKKSKAIGSFRLTGSINVFADVVQLPRSGCLSLHEHDCIPRDGKILSATVSEQAGRWFVSIQMEVEEEKPTPTTPAAFGVDLGIKILAKLSNGKTFANLRALQQAQKRLRRLERHKSRRKKGGKNRKKTCRCLARQHAHVANVRRDAASVGIDAYGESSTDLVSRSGETALVEVGTNHHLGSVLNV